MIKKALFLSNFLFLAMFAFSQTVELQQVTDAQFHNTGTLTALPSPVIYTFYEAGPSKQKDHIKGVFAIYDAQMNLKFSDSLDLHPDNKLMQVKDNEKEIIAAFYNETKEEITFRIYNDNGAKLREETLYYKSNIYGNFYGNAEDIGEAELIRPQPEKGFFIYQYVKNKRLGYNYYFLTSTGIQLIWKSPEDHNNRKNATLLYADEDLMVIHERDWSSVYDQQPLMAAIVIDFSTSKEHFRVSHDYQKRPRFYTSVLRNEKDELIFFGETYNKANNYPDNDYNSGYFSERYNMNGTLLHDVELPYEDPVFLKDLGLSSKNGRKKLGTVYVYQLITDGDGFAALGEWALRESQGGGAGAALLAYSSGTTGFQKWSSSYLLGDFVLMKFGTDGSYKGSHLLPKTHVLKGLNDLRPRPQFNLNKMKYLGRMNYQFEVPGHSNSFFYVDETHKKDVIDFKLLKAEPSNGFYSTTEITSFTIPQDNFYRLYPLTENSVVKVSYETENQKLAFSLITPIEKKDE